MLKEYLVTVDMDGIPWSYSFLAEDVNNAIEQAEDYDRDNPILFVVDTETNMVEYEGANG